MSRTSPGRGIVPGLVVGIIPSLVHAGRLRGGEIVIRGLLAAAAQEFDEIQDLARQRIRQRFDGFVDSVSECQVISP